MKTYKITYSFDGVAQVKIKAKTKAEAKELFWEGEFDNEKIVKEDNWNLEDIIKI